MALPAGVTVCRAVFGTAVDYTGDGVAFRGELTPMVQRSGGAVPVTLVHRASGQQLVPLVETVYYAAGSTAELVLPHTDQPGLIDARTGLEVSGGWWYRLTGKWSTGNGTRAVAADPKNFQLPGPAQTADVDVLPQAVPVSVASGAMTTAELQAALAAQAQTSTQLDARIDELEAQPSGVDYPGDGTKYLSGDGTWKTITASGSVDLSPYAKTADVADAYATKVALSAVQASIPTSPSDIQAATSEQGERADSAVQPADLTAATESLLSTSAADRLYATKEALAAVQAAVGVGASTPFDVALIGDSLIEGLGYTSSHAATVGRLLVAKGAAPHRYWLPASGHEAMLFAVSSQPWATAQPAYNGIPYSFLLQAGQSVEWPLESPARVAVWVRRDNGSAAHTLPVAVTSASGQSGTLSGAQQDPSGFGIERVVIDSPGEWVRVTAPNDKIQIFGVQVFVTTGSGGSGVYAFGQSGMASDFFAQQTHQWLALANLVARLGVTHVVTNVMVNDAIAGRSAAEYVTNINTAINQLAQAGISRVSGLAMPNLGGRDLSAYRAALLQTDLSDVWEDTSLGSPGNVGADGTHLTEAGNEKLASILADRLAPAGPSIPTTVGNDDFEAVI